jgi:hypothetical protein
MDENAFKSYVDERYNEQMKYYSDASAKNQKKYKRYQWILIVLSALTPVIAALNGLSVKFKPDSQPISLNLSLVVVVISSIVAILTTSLKTFNYLELWITYRASCEKLKPEIHYYHFNVGDYGKPGVDKESLFVSRVEALLDTEHAQWPAARKLQEDQSQQNSGDNSSNGGNNKEASATNSIGETHASA